MFTYHITLMKSIWWIKRDMRLHDNDALFHALQDSTEVLPVYIFEDVVLHGPDASAKHADAQIQGITALKKNLQHHGSDLYVAQGHIIEELQKLKKHYPFEAIYSHQETGLNHTFKRDKEVATWCAYNNIQWCEQRHFGVVRGLEDRDKRIDHFNDYLAEPIRSIPKELKPPKNVPITTVPSLSNLGFKDIEHELWPVSERAAHDTLHDFLFNRGEWYRGGISTMNKAPRACSRISLHLAWGTISLRTVFAKTRERREDAAVAREKRWSTSLKHFTSRLYWHSHFIQKLEDEVEMEFLPQNKAFTDRLPVCSPVTQKKRLKAWKTGTTGYPYMDACLRYYDKYGWLNFRGRASITSFAIHGLRLPWQTILYELAKLMSDYVPGIHVAQVQMQAGITGTNTIRVYSPHKQGLDHDPDATFIKSQIPELRDFSAAEIHDFQNRALGEYPRPIVDFSKESKKVKDVLYAIKKSPEGRKEAKRVYKRHGSRSRIRTRG